jgi:hypothetical protein
VRGFDEPVDSRLSAGDVTAQYRFALHHSDAVWVCLTRRQPMAEADGSESGNIRVDVIAKTFGFFQ